MLSINPPPSQLALLVAVTELSALFVFVSFLATSFQTALNVASSFTGKSFYETAATAVLPLVVIVYTGGIFAQPRRRDRRTMNILRSQFFIFSWVSEISYVSYEAGIGNYASTLTHIGRCMLETLIFHYGFKVSEKVRVVTCPSVGSPLPALTLFLTPSIQHPWRLSSLLITLFAASCFDRPAPGRGTELLLNRCSLQERLDHHRFLPLCPIPRHEMHGGARGRIRSVRYNRKLCQLYKRVLGVGLGA